MNLDACHCGQPLRYGYDGDPNHTRGMCADCDDTRCDEYPDECPYMHAGGAVSDETTTPAHPDRPTSTKPVDERWVVQNVRCSSCGQIGLHACNGEQRRLRNLAESHAHEADRLAHERAGLTHALLAHFWLNNARQETP